MAKRISDEDIRLNIIINGDKAKKELFDLEKSTRELTTTNKELRAERAKLSREGKQGTEEYKNLTKRINENSVVLTNNRKRMEQLQNQIGLTGLSMNQLRRKAAILRSSLNGMTPGSAEYVRLRNDLKKVTARITELNSKAKATKLSMASIADGFNRYAALGASVIATGTGVVLSLQKIIDINGKLSDAQSNVRKTTGLTQTAVDELTKSFGLMKTRTARIELLGLAEEAGRLGIQGVENVKAFVEQANKMKVALGDDLSDESIREVGKMVNVYKVGEATGKDFAGAMDALGSSINEVSASGANQAGFLVDYLKRQAGIAAQTKLSAADNVGYAATFDEIGQSVEVSATAMNKVWMDMFKQPQEFAKIAGVSLNEFKRLLKEDANEAMLLFLEGLNGNKEGLDSMLESMKDLEVGGARGVQALAALASNTELLRKRQQISNQALTEASSLTNEYNLKNTNLAATLEKLQKRIIGIFSSETVVNWLTNSVEWFAKFIGATEDADGSVGKFKNRLMIIIKVFSVLLAALITNVAWQKMVFLWTNRNTQATLLYNLAVKARAVAERAGMILSQAYAAVTMLLRGNMLGAAQAFRVMTSAMMTTPWGFVLAMVAAGVTAYKLFNEEVTAAAEVQKTMNDVHLTTTQNIAKEKSELELLQKVASDERISKEKRLQAIEELNKTIPDYIGNLTLENIKTKEGIAILKKYTDELYKNARAKAVQSKFDELAAKRLEVEAKTSKDFEGTGQKISDFIFGETEAVKDRAQVEAAVMKMLKATGQGETEAKTGAFIVDQEMFDRMVADRMAQLGLDEKEKEIALLDAQMKVLAEELQKQFIESKGPSTTDTTDTTDTTPTGDPDKRTDDIRKAKEEQLKIEREYEDAILALMDEGFAKERQKLETEHTRKIEDLENRMVAETEIQKALANSRNDQLSQQERTYWAKQAAFWIDNNKHLHGLVELELETHEHKKGILREEWRTKEIQEKQAAFEREAVVRETAYLEELNTLGENDRAKKALQKKFQKEELDRQKAHLENLIRDTESQLSTLNQSFDGAFLTESQREVIESEIEQLKLKIQELLQEKAKLTGDSEEGTEAFKNTFGDVDVLGFSAKQWEDTFSNIENLEDRLKATRMVVRGLQNIWSKYASFQKANEDAQLQVYVNKQDARKFKLKSQLDQGVIRQEDYNRRVERIDRELEERKFRLQYQQAKREKSMAMTAAIISTSEAVTAALTAGPGAGQVLAAITAALGAVEIATIAKQPLPTRGYEKGYYPEYVKREQDGRIFKSTFGGTTRSGVVNKPTHFLTGENGPEMIIDNKAFREMNPELRGALIRELRGIKGFENGFYRGDTFNVPVNNQPSSTAGDSEIMAMYMKALNNNTEVMKDLLQKGVFAIMTNRDLRSMGYLKEGLKEYDKLRNNSKK